MSINIFDIQDLNKQIIHNQILTFYMILPLIIQLIISNLF